MPKETDKPVAFQGIRPAQCRCTTEKVCGHCKGKRRDTPWAEAVRMSNRKYIEAGEDVISGETGAINADDEPMILAAPELLATANGALGYLESLPLQYMPDATWFAPLRPAIKKAEGK